MDRFAGRVALVTGASSGIGAHLAERLVQEGLVVVAVARRQERLEDLAAKVSKNSKVNQGSLHTVVADISMESEVRRVYEWIHSNLGQGVSVVVNNAALLLLQPMQDLSAVSIQQIVSTNLTAVMLSCREALLSMKQHQIKDGHIVNINSVLGHKVMNSPVPSMSTSVYTSTKHAITALCKGLRYDVQRLEGFKIRVTSISPGGVATEMIPKAYLDGLKDPDYDVLKVEDVVNAVMFALSSPQAVEISELSLNAVGEKS